MEFTKQPVNLVTTNFWDGDRVYQRDELERDDHGRPSQMRYYYYINFRCHWQMDVGGDAESVRNQSLWASKGE